MSRSVSADQYTEHHKRKKKRKERDKPGIEDSLDMNDTQKSDPVPSVNLDSKKLKLNISFKNSK